MNEAERLRELLDGSMDPSELETYKEYYKLAERIYGREALDEIGISTPKEVEEELEPLANNEFTHDVILPKSEKKLEDSPSDTKEKKKKRRVFILLIGIIGLILVSSNIIVGMNSIIGLCEDQEQPGEIEFTAIHQVNGNTMSIFWTVTNTTIDNVYTITWDISQNGSQELVESGEMDFTANGESFTHSTATNLQVEPYAYFSTLLDANRTELDTLSGHYPDSEMKTMSSIEDTKLCDDNPKLKISEIMNYEDLESWGPAGEGEIIDGMLLMIFTFMSLFGLTKKK